MVDNADALLVLEVVVEELGSDEVLDDLVLDHAEVGLLHRHEGELGGGVQPGLDHRQNNAVNRLLVQRTKCTRSGGGARDDGVDLRLAVTGEGGLWPAHAAPPKSRDGSTPLSRRRPQAVRVAGPAGPGPNGLDPH
jgi:hypothetical protein